MSSSSPAHLHINDVPPRSGTANGSEDNKNAKTSPLLPPSSPQREPNQQITMSLNEPATPAQTNSGKGKRKADDVDGSPGGTPPDGKKQQRATFAADPRPHRASGTSGSSHAPSSYSTRKRARLSVAASTSAAGLAATMSALGENKNESGSGRPPSRSNSRQGHHHNGTTTGTWTSSRSRNGGNPNLNGHSPPTRSQSRASRRSFGANPMPSPSRNSFAGGHSQLQTHADDRAPSRLSRRGSISGASIPISALISPHAPSVSRNSAIYHMRDPHKPPRVQPTPWSLSFPQAGYGEEDYLRGRIKHVVRSLKTRRVLKSLASKFGRKGNADEDGDKEKEEHDDDDREPGTSSPLGWTDGGGSPLHAWLFFAGFIIFPLWWIAGFLVGVRKTRRIGSGQEGERGVVLDDPQVEYDAKTWRSRCRIMALVSLVTYVPFIVLVAVFAPS